MERLVFVGIVLYSLFCDRSIIFTVQYKIFGEREDVLAMLDALKLTERFFDQKRGGGEHLLSLKKSMKIY